MTNAQPRISVTTDPVVLAPSVPMPRNGTDPQVPQAPRIVTVQPTANQKGRLIQTGADDGTIADDLHALADDPVALSGDPISAGIQPDQVRVSNDTINLNTKANNPKVAAQWPNFPQLSQASRTSPRIKL